MSACGIRHSHFSLLRSALLVFCFVWLFSTVCFWQISLFTLFWRGLDIIVTKHTKIAKWSEILWPFETPSVWSVWVCFRKMSASGIRQSHCSLLHLVVFSFFLFETPNALQWSEWVCFWHQPLSLFTPPALIRRSHPGTRERDRLVNVIHVQWTSWWFQVGHILRTMWEKERRLHLIRKMFTSKNCLNPFSSEAPTTIPACTV